MYDRNYNTITSNPLLQGRPSLGVPISSLEDLEDSPQHVPNTIQIGDVYNTQS